MFDHMRAQPLFAIGTCSIESAIPRRLAITKNAYPYAGSSFLPQFCCWSPFKAIQNRELFTFSI